MRARRRARVKEWIVKLWADERVRTVVVSGVEMALMLFFPLFSFASSAAQNVTMYAGMMVGMALVYTAWTLLCVRFQLYTRASTLYLNVEWCMIYCIYTPWVYALNYHGMALIEVVDKVIALYVLVPRAIGFLGNYWVRRKADPERRKHAYRAWCKAWDENGWVIAALSAGAARVMVIVVAGLMNLPSGAAWTVPMALRSVGILLLIYALRLGAELWLCKKKILRKLEWQVLALQDLAMMLVIGTWLVPNEHLDPVEALLLWVWLLGTAAVRTVVGWKTGFWRKEA